MIVIAIKAAAVFLLGLIAADVVRVLLDPSANITLTDTLLGFLTTTLNSAIAGIIYLFELVAVMTVNLTISLINSIFNLSLSLMTIPTFNV